MIYIIILLKGKSTEKEQLRAAQYSAFLIGIISTLFALGLKNINVTSLVSLTFIVAASSNLPVIVLTIYWRRFTQSGAIIGMVTGLLASIILLMIGPNIMDPINGWIQKEPIINLLNPGIISIPIGFLSAIIASLLTKPDKNFDFEAFYLKAQTGISKDEVIK